MARVKTYRIPENWHKSLPIVMDSIMPRHEVGVKEYEVEFTASCAYHFKNQDGTTHYNQKDFNKTRGNSFCYGDNHQNSAMGGWRWNPYTEKMELTSYYHVDGNRYMGPTKIMVNQGTEEISTISMKTMGFENYLHYLLSRVEIMATVSIGERFRLRTLTDWDRMEFGVGYRKEGHFWIDDWQHIPQARPVSRGILWWFGGNFKAPHTMKIRERKI